MEGGQDLFACLHAAYWVRLENKSNEKPQNSPKWLKIEWVSWHRVRARRKPVFSTESHTRARKSHTYEHKEWTMDFFLSSMIARTRPGSRAVLANLTINRFHCTFFRSISQKNVIDAETKSALGFSLPFRFFEPRMHWAQKEMLSNLAQMLLSSVSTSRACLLSTFGAATWRCKQAIFIVCYKVRVSCHSAMRCFMFSYPWYVSKLVSCSTVSQRITISCESKQCILSDSFRNPSSQCDAPSMQIATTMTKNRKKGGESWQKGERCWWCWCCNVMQMHPSKLEICCFSVSGPGVSYRLQCIASDVWPKDRKMLNVHVANAKRITSNLFVALNDYYYYYEYDDSDCHRSRFRSPNNVVDDDVECKAKWRRKKTCFFSYSAQMQYRMLFLRAPLPPDLRQRATAREWARLKVNADDVIRCATIYSNLNSPKHALSNNK